jgi:hypothetical protein
LHKNTDTYKNFHYDWTGKSQSLESREKISKSALLSKHRRLRKGVAKYLKADGIEVMLDSSWELALAKRLDKIGINWIRPKPIIWVDKQKSLCI